MKKNAMLKIAAILMVAVLLTTCAISSTFAKYTTSGTDKATARVAKWGVTVETTLDGLFAEYRVDENNKFVVKGAYTESTEDDADYIVAPGMNGKVTAASTIKGTPEVAVAISTAATVELKGWGEVCPLTFKVGEKTLTQGDLSVDEFAQAIETEIAKAAVTFEAGTDLAGKANVTEISWSWEFEAGADDDEIAANDEIDTAIAELKTATIYIELETVVSQVETLTLN